MRGGAMRDRRDPAPAERALAIDRAVDHISVAEAAEKGVLEAMEVVLALCEAFGVGGAS